MSGSRSILIKNTLIIAVGKLSTQFLTFLLLPIYTAYLSTAEFGAVDLTLTYVSLLTPLFMLSVEMATFRFLVDSRKDREESTKVITNALFIASTGALAIIVLFAITRAFVTIPYGLIIPAAIVAMIFSSIFLQIARGFGNNLIFAISSIVIGTTTIGMNIIFVIALGMGAEGILLAIVIANTVGAVFTLFSLKIYRFISPQANDPTVKRKLLGYSLPLVPNSISWWVINAADRTIITLILGVAANGIYAVAYKFPLIFNGLFSFFGMSWTESASVHINSPSRDKFFSQTMNASVKLFGAFGAVIIAGIPFIFSLFVSKDFAEAYVYIPILIIGAFLNSVVGLYSAIYIAKKLTKQVMTTSLMAAAINISFTLIFIHFIGIFAAAIAMVIAFLSMAIFRHYDMKKYVKITYEPAVFWKLAGLYAVAVLGYYTLGTWGAISGAVLAGVGSAWMNRGAIKTLTTAIGKKVRKT